MSIAALESPTEDLSVINEHKKSFQTPRLVQKVSCENAPAHPLPSQEVREGVVAALPNLRAFAMSLCGRSDLADDLVQETVMRAWAKAESYRDGTNLMAWLFTILRNEFYSHLRKRKREVEDIDGDYAAELTTPSAQIPNLEVRDFRAALAMLPDEQREAIILIGASGFSYDEAASVMGCAIGTVKSRLNRARARLREILDGDELSDGQSMADG